MVPGPLVLALLAAALFGATTPASTSGLGGPRLIGGHTNDGRGNRVHSNIFHGTGRAAIEFTNTFNQSDGNIFSRMPGGFLRILRPEPQAWLDLEFWRGAVVMMMIATLTAAFVTNGGRSAWFMGVLVLTVYLIFALTLYLLPPAGA